MQCRYFTHFDVDIQGYKENFRDFSETVRPASCPSCDTSGSLHKHGTYSRTVYDLNFMLVTIEILRYYCPRCGCTVSILPDFLLPHKRYCSMLISLCLYLLFSSEASIHAVHDRYSKFSRYLIYTWLRQWWYGSRNVLMVLGEYFDLTVLPVKVSDSVKSSYITQESLRAFLGCCDLILGGEIDSCHGKCGITGGGKYHLCDHRTCYGLLRQLQVKLSGLPFQLRVL